MPSYIRSEVKSLHEVKATPLHAHTGSTLQLSQHGVVPKHAVMQSQQIPTSAAQRCRRMPVHARSFDRKDSELNSRYTRSGRHQPDLCQHNGWSVTRTQALFP